MKILESQAAALTNYEVYTHLLEQRQRYASFPRSMGNRPGSLETLVKELLAYFNEAPSPLAPKPLVYKSETIRQLLERLRPYDLTKAEVLMIMNLRPTKPEILNTMVEELENRFDDEKQWQLCNDITEILGKPDGEAERQAMATNAEEARKQRSYTEPKVNEEDSMDVDQK